MRYLLAALLILSSACTSRDAELRALQARLDALEGKPSSLDRYRTEVSSRLPGPSTPAAAVRPAVPVGIVSALGAAQSLSALAWLMGGPPILGARITSSGGAPGSAGLPAGCDDNDIARADGTAGATQCSAATISDNGDLIPPAGRGMMAFADANDLIFRDGSGFEMGRFVDLGGAGSAAIRSPMLQINDANTRIFETGTNDIAIEAVGGDVLFSSVTTLQIGDANVAISETGTNDLSFTADNTLMLTLTGNDITIKQNVPLYFVDANVAISETGTNDLALTADGAVIATLDASGLLMAANGDRFAASVFSSSADGQGITFYDNATGSQTLGVLIDNGTTGYMRVSDATGYQIVDANVAITETGTNDLALTADGAVAGTFSSTGLTLAQNLTVSGTTVNISGSSIIAGSERLILTPTGTYGVDIATSGSKAACDATNRGSIFHEAGGAGVADVFYVCTKSTADAYAWRDIAAPTP